MGGTGMLTQTGNRRRFVAAESACQVREVGAEGDGVLKTTRVGAGMAPRAGHGAFAYNRYALHS